MIDAIRLSRSTSLPEHVLFLRNSDYDIILVPPKQNFLGCIIRVFYN